MSQSYDFFERLNNHYSSKLPFVVYRKPNSDLVMSILQKNIELHKALDYTESGFLFAPFDDKEQALLIPFDKSEIDTISYDINTKVEISKYIDNVNSHDKSYHIKLVQKGIDSINSGKLKKVVLSRCETINISESNPIKLFIRLLHTYIDAFIYCWYHPNIGLWLGATPETLLKINGNSFETMALAGTQLYKNEMDVIWGHKELEEQRLVTDYIINNLQSSVGPQNIQVSEVMTVKAANLLHLKTKITGTLNFKLSNFKNFLTTIHPTPAICGIPKESAKKFILSNEGYNREYYSGFLGELNLLDKKTRNSNRQNIENNAYSTLKRVSNLYVNLRCMQIYDSKAKIYVGGGITKDSIADHEWIETVNKTNTVKKVLS